MVQGFGCAPAGFLGRGGKRVDVFDELVGDFCEGYIGDVEFTFADEP